MKRIVPASLLLVAVIGVLSTGAIAKPPKAQPHPNSMTRTLVAVDANSCTDSSWATDTVKRKVKVHRLTAGATSTYRVKILDKGTFLTTGGVSPGNCEQNTSNHGTSVLAGKSGKVRGSMTGTVTGVFNPAGFDPATTCTAAAPCTMAELVVALFGAGAQFTCAGSSADCKLNYKYKAKDASLVNRTYDRKSKGAGTLAVSHVKGDVATG